MAEQKKKWNRRCVGSVLKSKEPGGAPYLKFRDAVTVPAGGTLRLESKKAQLESLATAVAAGKISQEIAEKAKERIENIPEWVLFEIVSMTSEG